MQNSKRKNCLKTANEVSPAKAGTHLRRLLITNPSYVLIFVDQLQDFDLEPVALDSEQVSLLAGSGIPLAATLSGSGTP
ncbi:hypothetical protein SBDP1_190017 [Syntrophobacter sp. SbD1]|nr:hypothetical protein SBDP1_190017 [Syntrophobacter sp. SbD1]